MSLAREFALIARHFRPLAAAVPGALSLTDDAALLDPPEGRTLVLAADAMVEGVHFLPDDPPETIGRKLLRVNLSDLAAMGAAPLGYLLTTALPKSIDDGWLASFARGLAADQKVFECGLFGGDTVATPGPLALSLTILGSVAPGRALTRAGGRVGDEVWVSGTIGDGALGLLALTGRLPDLAEADREFLAERYRLPRPRVILGQRLAGLATACLDISDGLVQDLGHLAHASGCAAEIEAAALPLSSSAAAVLERDPALLATCLAGGDDYELVFSAPADAAERVEKAGMIAGVPVTRIGRLVAGEGVRVLAPDGGVIPLERAGWSHFG